MSRPFPELLEQLRERIARMTALVRQIVEQASDSVFRIDPRLAQQCIALDKKIDDEEVKIEQDAIALLALSAPAAGDLRLLTTIIKANSDLERVADCAVNIAQRVLPLSHMDRYHPPADLKLMANTVQQTLRDAIQAFNLTDADLARQVLRSDDVVDALYHQIVQDMLVNMETTRQQVNMDLSNIMIAKNLERIADHCTNIAEDVIYVASGQIIRHTHAG